MFSYNLAENSIGFSYYLVENIRFTTNLEENSLLFTSATSFTLKKRALLSPSESSKHRLAAEPNMETVTYGIFHLWHARLERTKNRTNAFFHRWFWRITSIQSPPAGGLP